MYDCECSFCASLMKDEVTPHSGARSTPPDCDALNMMYRNGREADGTVWLSTPEIEGPILEELGRQLGGPAIGVG